MPRPIDLDDCDGAEDHPRRRRHRPVDDEPELSRGVYIFLAVFLGWAGVHNFYAGRTLTGLVQLMLSGFMAFTGLALLGQAPFAGILVIFAIVLGLWLAVSILSDIIHVKPQGPRKCPECLGSVPLKARRCRHCGERLPIFKDDDEEDPWESARPSRR